MLRQLPVLETKDDFKNLVASIEAQPGYRQPIGFGICSIYKGQLNPEKILQATFPVVNWGKNFGSAAVFIAALQYAGEEVDFSDSEQSFFVDEEFLEYAMAAFAPFLDEASGEEHKNVQVVKFLDSFGVDNIIEALDIKDYFQGTIGYFAHKVVLLFEDKPVKSVETAYLKLYALSTAKAALRSLNLNGVFATLHNCAWSADKPYELDWLRKHKLELDLLGQYPHIDFVDKFPRFLQHIIPADNTRILDTAKVRFGAQVGAGTTVMPGASYINFNAGTLGKSMVEGRISSSAVVGEGSDVGGGASILGVLSGTNGNPITVGENCLIGANAVCGIPLGDGSIIDAGLAILEGTKISICKVELEKIKEANEGKIPEGKDEGKYFVVKGSDIGGFKGVHFRQDSKDGKIRAFRSKREIKLNEALH